MLKIRPLADEVPAINVTSPGPSDPPSSPVTLEALDDSRLTPVPPMPKTSLDQHRSFINPSVPQPVMNHSFPHYNPSFGFFNKATNLLETQNNFSHCGTCQIHSHENTPGKENKNSYKRKAKVEEEDDRSKRRPKEAIPFFSSPWGPSSCTPKGALWKEVEEYNRQRKRVRFLGSSGIESPFETETSSTVCSEKSECPDADDRFRQMKWPDGVDEDQTLGGSGGIEEGEGMGQIEGIKVVITTSKDGTTTTILSAEPHATPRHGVEIVTKTVIRGNEVMTLTTTTLIPLAWKTVLAD